jgi:hypothetical protein
LFKAKHIGELLEIKDIKSTIKDFDSDEKVVHSARCNNKGARVV